MFSLLRIYSKRSLCEVKSSPEGHQQSPHSFTLALTHLVHTTPVSVTQVSMPTSLILLLLACLLISPLYTAGSEIEWSSCQLTTKTASVKDYSLFGDFTYEGSQGEVQCASIQVPLRWDRRDERQIDFFVKKYPSLRSPPKGSMWFLQGGPGNSGASLEQVAMEAREKLQYYNVYVPDYRGTGRSNRLTCSNGVALSHSKAEVKACFEEIENEYDDFLQGFSSENAALDVLHFHNLTLQEQPSSESSEFILYGVSFGTLWLERILNIAPKGVVTKAVADSLLDPTRSLLQVDDHFLEAGSRFVKTCQQTKFCNDKFDNKVETIMKEVFEQQSNDEEKCGGYWSAEFLQKTAARLLVSEEGRKLIFPVFYRLYRCSREDRVFLDNLQLALISGVLGYRIDGTVLDVSRFSPADFNSAESSDALYALVGMSELGSLPPNQTREEYLSKYSLDNLDAQQPPYFQAEFSPLLYDVYNSIAELEDPILYSFNQSKWDLENTGKRYTGPLLMLHGELDPQTPLSHTRIWERAFNSSNQKLIIFPNAIHRIITSTEMKDDANHYGPTQYCGFNILIRFIEEGDSSYNTECVDNGWTLNSPTMQFESLDGDSIFSYVIGDQEGMWEGGKMLSYREVILIVIASILVAVVLCCACTLCCVFCCCCIEACRKRRRRRKRYARTETTPEEEENHAAAVDE